MILPGSRVEHRQSNAIGSVIRTLLEDLDGKRTRYIKVLWDVEYKVGDNEKYFFSKDLKELKTLSSTTHKNRLKLLINRDNRLFTYRFKSENDIALYYLDSRATDQYISSQLATVGDPNIKCPLTTC